MGTVLSTALLIIGLLYLLLCAALFLLQRSLIYFPQPRSTGAGADLLSLPLADGPAQGSAGERVLITARLRPGAKALLYFGGNAEDVALQLPLLAKGFPDHALYLLHYRGYGGSGGRPSEAALFADALALFDRVQRDHRRIAVVGRSLGSAVAVHLAARRPVARLVLVTPFDSLAAVAQARFPLFPVRLLLQDKYRSWLDAPRVAAPTLLIAAEQDEVIPRSSTEALLSRFRPGVASLAVLPVDGHNAVDDSPLYVALLRAHGSGASPDPPSRSGT
jgi:pimeloyl-ACP methyl ester carboxylesterase